MEKTYNAAPCRTASEFWYDLQIQFGKDAKSVALSYLDTITAQERRTGKEDHEEFLFCCELFRLISD